MGTLQQNLKAQLDKSAFTAGVENTPSEPVIYNPAAGDPRPIEGKVRREDGEYGNGPTPGFILTVSNDAVLGITSDEIDVGHDTISIAERLGEELAERTIITLQRHNSAVLVIHLN